LEEHSIAASSTVLQRTGEHSAAEHSAAEHSSVRVGVEQEVYSIVQYGTAQYNTVEYSTVQYSKTQCSVCVCVVPWGYGDLRARQTVNFTNYRTLEKKIKNKNKSSGAISNKEECHIVYYMSNRRIIE
jgi:hypothetical protein